MSDNKNVFSGIEISSGGIRASKFNPEGLKQAVNQLLTEHQEFAESSYWNNQFLEAKKDYIRELEENLQERDREIEELKEQIEASSQRVTVGPNGMTIDNRARASVITYEDLEKAAMTMHNQTVDTLWGESGSECEADMRVMRRSLEAIGIRVEGNPAKKPVKVGDSLMANQLGEVPRYSVIIDEDDDPWKKAYDDRWYFPGRNRGYDAEEMAFYEPFTVLSLPGEDT